MTRPARTKVVLLLTCDPQSGGPVVEWAEAVAGLPAIYDVSVCVVRHERHGAEPEWDGLRSACASVGMKMEDLSVRGGTTFGAMYESLGLGPEDGLLMADVTDVPAPMLVERLLEHTLLRPLGVATAVLLPLPVSNPEISDGRVSPRGRA